MAIATDVHSNRYAAVHVEELAKWAWLLGRLEDGLTHAWPDAVDDWTEFTGPGGARIEDIVCTSDFSGV